MNKQPIDLRDLLIKIKEKKELEATLMLEFDCRLEVEDPTMLIKVINYAINYVKEMSETPMQMSLNATNRGYSMSFTIATEKEAFPPLNQKVAEALKQYNGTIALDGEPGKYVQMSLSFQN